MGLSVVLVGEEVGDVVILNFKQGLFIKMPSLMYSLSTGMTW